MEQSQPRPLLLSGRVVHPDGSARQRYVLVRDGRVTWVGVSRPPDALCEGAREIVTGPRGWIFPGLVNLHTHASYNVLPLWHSRKAPFDNRFEWRSDPDYRARVGNVLKTLGDVPRSQQTIGVVSELQAIAGGTTVLDKPTRLDANLPAGPPIVLCRVIGAPAQVGLAAGRRIDSVVDFFRPAAGVPTPVTRGRTTLLDAYATDREAGNLGAVLVHLAEGRSGFGSGRGVDPYSRAEFEAFMAHRALRDAGRVRAVPLSVVHGCGIDVDNPAHLAFLRDRDISIVWSPVSNLLLYGDTLDVGRLMQSGLNVALGSDWSPSGSKHVWDEAKIARRFLAAIGSTISDADVFRMATANAARCLGSQALGRLEPGAFADMFILESPIDSDSALEVFFSTEDRDVLATIVNGVPIYGDRTFLQQFGLPLQNLPRREGSAAAGKAVHLPPHISVDLGAAIDAVEDHLKSLTSLGPRGVQRSNLLASSDKPYQRRMQRLRSEIETFGWSAKQTARRFVKRQPPMNGRVPVPPSSVRVWCGFMAGTDRARFLEQLGSVFMPSTVMLMRDLGLTGYFPAVPPADHPAECPDEAAIVFYESPQVYKDALLQVGGRIYATLHQSVFRFGPTGSWSTFPVRLPRRLRSRTAYYLFDEPIDWYSGRTHICIGVRDATRDSIPRFHAKVLRACRGVQHRPAGIDGALVAIDDDCFVFWDHRDANTAGERPLEAFAGAGRLVMSAPAEDRNANGTLFERFPGFPLKGGECLRLTFERRAFFPW